MVFDIFYYDFCIEQDFMTTSSSWKSWHKVVFQKAKYKISKNESRNFNRNALKLS